MVEQKVPEQSNRSEESGSETKEKLPVINSKSDLEHRSKRVLLISLILFIAIIILTIPLLFQKISFKDWSLNLNPIGIDGKPCLYFLLCRVRSFEQEGFVSEIIDISQSSGGFSMANVNKKEKGAEYTMKIGYKEDHLFARKPTKEDSSYWYETFWIKDFEAIDLLYQNKSISTKEFLKESSGAKVVIQGESQSRFTGSSTEIFFKISSIHILEE